MIGTDCIGSGKSNYHTILTTTAEMMYKDLIFKNVSILCKYKKKNKFASKRFFVFFKLYIGIGLVVYSRMENNMHIRIISPRGEVRDHTFSLTPPLFIEVHVRRPVNERSHM